MVFVDTYTNYHFTKIYGRNLEAEKIIAPELLKVLNEIHCLSTEKRTTKPERYREFYQTSLIWEQENTVARGVIAEVKKFDCPILRTLLLKPMVHFHYFSSIQYLFFRDFSKKEERIRNAMKSYDIAVSVGWDNTVAAIQKYQILPELFFRAPQEFLNKLKT